MKKFIIILMVLGFVFAGVLSSQGATTRTTPHKFRAFTTNTEGVPGANIYRITGVATGSSSVFGIYNTTTLETASVTVLAVEGGEETSGDALPLYEFGGEGLRLDAGITVIVSNCVIVIEYL